MKIYEEPIQESDPSYLRLVKAIYNSCMNTTQIEKESLSFVKKEFKDLGGWPVIEPYWNEKLFDWKNLLYRLRRMNWRRTYFFSMYIATDLKNSSKTIFTVSRWHKLAKLDPTGADFATLHALRETEEGPQRHRCPSVFRLHDSTSCALRSRQKHCSFGYEGRHRVRNQSG
jgi:hypothetical protein